MRALLSTCVGLFVASAPAAVEARPYTVVARYGPSSSDAQVRLTLRPDAHIPDSDVRYRLQDIAIHFDEKPFGLLPARAFEDFSVAVVVDGEPCDDEDGHRLEPGEGGGDFSACRWRSSRSFDQGVHVVQITVKARVSDDLLCAVEARHRELTGEDVAAGVLVAPYKDKRPARKLKRGAQELLASYCRGVDWDAAATAAVLSDWKVASAGALEEAQEAALFAKIEGDLKGYFASWAQFDKDDPAVVTEVFELSVFRTGEIFLAKEDSPEGRRDLSNVVDVKSDLLFDASFESGYCPPIKSPPFRYTVGIVGDEESIEAMATSDGPASCSVLLPIDFTKLAGKRLQVNVLYGADDGKELVLYKRKFTPHAVGFSWSLPVASELGAIAKGWSKDEFRAQSSLPLSWAIGMGSADSGVALTVPFKMTYATRQNPNLGEMFAFYPHLSVIVTESDAGSSPVTVAAGVGVNLAKSFFFSYALGFSGPHDGDHFVLIGLDIKDLAGLKPSF